MCVLNIASHSKLAVFQFNAHCNLCTTTTKCKISTAIKQRAQIQLSYVCIVIETPVKLVDKAWKQDHRVRLVPETKIVEKRLKTENWSKQDQRQSETRSGDIGVGQRHSSVEQVSTLNCRHTKVIFIIRNLTIITEESFIKVLRSQNFVSFYEKYLSH